MQSIALNEDGKAISADQAQKGKDYTCMSCGSSVRRRGGDWVRDHFYHLHETRDCHLSQKSETHLYLQLLLQKLLPPGEAILEEPFPSIKRFADVTWRRYKIVFEIQYSPISLEELEARLRDYKSVGWTTLWILHTHSFFKGRASREELFLEPYPHYFSNHQPNGKGTFFDVLWQGRQPPIVKEGVELHSPFRIPQNTTLLGIRAKRSLYFKNDLVDQTLQGKLNLTFQPKIKINSFQLYVKSFYNLFLESVFK